MIRSQIDRKPFSIYVSMRPNSNLTSLKTLHSIHSMISKCAAADRLSELFPSAAPTLILERAIGARFGADEELWETGVFKAGVYPDLPIANDWRELLGIFLGNLDKQAVNQPTLTSRGTHSQWLVPTIAAQCRSRQELRKLIREKGATADAMLLLSGSHPGRQLDFANTVFPSSFELLQMARQMRSKEEIPAGISLWAVENPMTSSPDRLRAKAESGAEVILTQPPMLEALSDAFFEAAHAHETTKSVKMVIGIPMISSVNNLDFWLRLANVRDSVASEKLLETFSKFGGDEIREWNVAFIDRALKAPGVAGLHLMPLTPAARAMTVDFIKNGILPSV